MGLDIYFQKGNKRDNYENAEELAYFRKANFLVEFFTAQYGYDEEEYNCKNFPVDRIMIDDLKERCQEVLADHNKADELLPSCEGFFYGSSDYDDSYFRQVEQCLGVCDKLLAEIDAIEASGGDDEITFYIWW